MHIVTWLLFKDDAIGGLELCFRHGLESDFFSVVDPPVLPIKTKALWAKKAGDAAPVERPLAITAAPSGTRRAEDPSSEEVPLRSRVTVAKRGAPASRAPFGRMSPAIQPGGEATSKRARVAPREGSGSPDVQSVAPPEPVARSSPLEVSSSLGEDQRILGRRSDKGM